MKLVLGTVQFGLDYGINNQFGRPTKEDVFRILDYANSAGITDLDTADVYGNAQDLIKEYSSRYPSNFFQIYNKSIFSGSESKDDIIAKSLKRLNVKKLKGYYFHRFFDFLNFKSEAKLADLLKLEKFDLLGVSLYSEEELSEVTNTDLVKLVQLPFNVFDQTERKRKLLQKCKELGKQIHVRSIFMQGLVFKNENEFTGNFVTFKKPMEKLKKVASDYNLSIEELCFYFVLKEPMIDKIVFGVDSLEQLKKNVTMYHKLVQLELGAKLLEEIEEIKVSDLSMLNPANWNT